MLPEKQDKAFADFYKSARFNRILDQKTTQLIHLVPAIDDRFLNRGSLTLEKSVPQKL